MLHPDVPPLIAKLDELRQTLKAAYVARDEAIELLVLAAVCKEHLLLLGPSGTAKTDLVTQFAQLIDAEKFSYLLTRFTEPTELFGPVNIEELGKGHYTVNTENMLPAAEIAFLDEIFHAGSAVLNTLLGIVNERRFHNGSAVQPVPLMTLVGAANDLPDDPSLAPIADRFLLRLVVEPVADADVPALLQLGWAHPWRREPGNEPRPITDVAALQRLNRAVHEIPVKPAIDMYVTVIRDLRRAGLRVSDRRAVRALALIAGAALLRGSDEVRPRDFWPLNHIWSAPADRLITQGIVQPLVTADGGVSLAPRRGPADILLEARNLATADPGPDPGGIVTGVRLQHLGRLRKDLRLSGDDEAIAQLDAIIDGLLADPLNQDTSEEETP